MELGVGILPNFWVPKNVAGTVYNWLTEIFSLLIFCQVVVRIKLEQIIHCTTLSKKKNTCASTKINTVPYQDYRDLDVCQLTKQRVFLKKRESVKELLLGLVLNEPTHISKFFAISRDTSCPHFFLHNLHCSWWFTLSCRTCLSWWFW